MAFFLLASVNFEPCFKFTSLFFFFKKKKKGVNHKKLADSVTFNVPFLVLLQALLFTLKDPRALCTGVTVQYFLQSTPIDIMHVLLNRLTVSHATENFWSKMAVHTCGTLSYFYYKITRVLAEISAHGEISTQREQYRNSFKCTSIFSLFLCLQNVCQQTVW